MGANAGGSNQFGNYTLQPAYGDVKKQTALTRAAPISGSPFSALQAPERAQARATRPRQQGQPQAPMPPVQAPQAPDPSVVYRQIAEIPNVTPVWRQLLG